VWLLRDASRQQHFKLGILGFDAAHVVSVCFFGVDVWHSKLGALLAFFLKYQPICWFTIITLAAV